MSTRRVIAAILCASGAAGCLLGPGDLRERGRYVASLAVGRGFVCSATAAGVPTCEGPEAPDLGAGAFVELSGRTRIACGRTAAGRVACGADRFGSAPEVPADRVFTAVGAGWSDVCAIDEDGAPACFGATPELALDAPGGPFASVAVGRWFACALDLDGAASCWGQDPPAPPPDRFAAIAVGADTACAVDIDGGLSCWGASSDWGRSLGPGPWVSVDVGEDSACAVSVDDALGCVGPSADGAPASAAEVAVGPGFGCAIDPSGALACFGEDPR